MKKILCVFLLGTVFLLNIAFAITNSTNWDSENSRKKINVLGSKILRANGVYSKIDFKVLNRKNNLCADANKEIYVRKELLKHVNSQDELAAALSHEIALVLIGHCNSKKVETDIKSLNLISSDDELEADMIASDLLYKSGYSPLALISLINKISGNYSDFLNVNPEGKQRLIDIYDYIDYNYKPVASKGYNSESFQKAMLLIQPGVDKRNSSDASVKKFEKTQKKLLSKKAKKAKKLKGTYPALDSYYITAY